MSKTHLRLGKSPSEKSKRADQQLVIAYTYIHIQITFRQLFIYIYMCMYDMYMYIYINMCIYVWTNMSFMISACQPDIHLSIWSKTSQFPLVTNVHTHPHTLNARPLMQIFTSDRVNNRMKFYTEEISIMPFFHAYEFHKRLR